MAKSLKSHLLDLPMVGGAVSRVVEETQSVLDLKGRLEQLQRNQALLALELARRGTVKPAASGTTSCLCTEARCRAPAYERWCRNLGEPNALHRKRWEFVFICEALEERGLLADGRRGLGFGVGKEPLVAYFASRGCHVMATDLGGDDARAAGWERGDQYASSLDTLNERGLCDWTAFRERTRYRPVDMNRIPEELTGYDYCWSACAFEHLGSIEAGLSFVENSLKTLKPGGVAIHTTEFNLSSNDETVERGHTVIFRRRDIEVLVERLAAAGHRVEPVDFDPGEGLLDRYVDVPPYLEEPHLRLRLGRFNCTSIGLIIRKAG